MIQQVVDQEPLDVSEVSRYVAGYLVCLILAVLYIFLMPIVGGIFTWRHYHGYNKGLALSSGYYWGVAIATCLAASTILLLAGVILAFTTNDRTRENMRPGLYHLSSSVGDVEEALRSIPEKIDLILEEYSVPEAEIERHLNGVGEDIGRAIITLLETEAEEAVRDLSVTVRDAAIATEALLALHTLRLQLQQRQTQLQSGLQQLTQRLEETRDSCPACSLPSTNQLRTNADYNQIPSMQPQLDKLPPAAEYSRLMEQVNSAFSGIPQICKNQTAPSVKVLIADLEKSRSTLNESRQLFPSLQSVSELVTDVRLALSVYGKQVHHYDYTRWAVGVTFCTLILFIAVLAAVGVALALPSLCCPTSSPAPGETQLNRIALTLLRIAVFLILIFSWLFIILVFITLFFGGNAHTLGCRSWKNGEIFEFFDQFDNLFSSLNATQSTNSTSALDLSTAEIYYGCMMGRSLFHSMELQRLFDMEDFLNVNKYMVLFRQNVHDFSINLEQIQVLPAEGRRNMLRFRDSAIDTIDYAAFQRLLGRPVLHTNLTVFAEQLDMAAETQRDTVVGAELQSQASEARDLNELVLQQEQDATMMMGSVTSLSVISDQYKENIDKSLLSTRLLQQAIQEPVQSIVGNVSECTLLRAEGALSQYLDWARHTIIYEVLECNWLSVSLDNVHTAMCENIVDPWNGFWLSLGWCCAFLLPTLIFSLFTANYLRPAKLQLPTAQDLSSPSAKETGMTEPNDHVTITKINILSS
ncbi:hypothetical protein GJAV_G00036150 [Gymnothorax javanicus]|nr:hypothetical protein GJAV_G00036150 [Gymnothorax javanicus]